MEQLIYNSADEDTKAVGQCANSFYKVFTQFREEHKLPAMRVRVDSYTIVVTFPIETELFRLYFLKGKVTTILYYG